MVKKPESGLPCLIHTFREIQTGLITEVFGRDGFAVQTETGTYPVQLYAGRWTIFDYPKFHLITF